MPDKKANFYKELIMNKIEIDGIKNKKNYQSVNEFLDSLTEDNRKVLMNLFKDNLDVLMEAINKRNEVSKKKN